MPYMDRLCDTQPGMKHRCTSAAMEYFRSEVMDMCHDAGLYQIDLLSGSKTRVTEREYWAKKKGQLALNEENAVLAEQDLPVKQTKFETDKEKLRKEIRMAVCELCGLEGEIRVEDGAWKFVFPAEDEHKAHDTISGKFLHADDIRKNEGRLMNLGNLKTIFLLIS